MVELLLRVWLPNAQPLRLEDLATEAATNVCFSSVDMGASTVEILPRVVSPLALRDSALNRVRRRVLNYTITRLTTLV